MTLKEYQTKAMSTCMPSCDNFSYMMLNLVGEMGELSSKIAKAIRRGELSVDDDNIFADFDDPGNEATFFAELALELGDILWQLTGLCNTFGFDLEDVAKYNLDKLASRKSRGVIDGNGDHR